LHQQFFAPFYFLENSVKFWLLSNFISPQHRLQLTEFAKQHNFEVEFVFLQVAELVATRTIAAADLLGIQGIVPRRYVPERTEASYLRRQRPDYPDGHDGVDADGLQRVVLRICPVLRGPHRDGGVLLLE
jgi:hypothetical protein